MNRLASIGIALVTACLPTLARSQESEASSPLLAPLRPGLTWKVEELPQFQKILSRDATGTRPQSSEPAAAGDEILIEENIVLTDGFRKQTLPSEKLTRYIRGTLVISESSSGKDFAIESLDPELVRDRISSRKLLEFAWIAAEWKIGAAVVDGVECDVFARPWPLDSTAGDSPPGASSRPDQRIFAAVGRNDKLPRRLESPINVRRYRFMMTNPPPELPAGAVLAIHRMNESAKEMAQRYAVPQ